MAVDVTLTVVGVKDALRELNTIDKVARREITRDYKRLVQSVVDDAQGMVPIMAPMSGMNRRWTTKSGFQMLPFGMGDDTVSAGVSGRKVKQFSGFSQNLATFYVRFNGPTAVLWDMAGKGKVPTARGQQMVKTLTERLNRPPSRILWPAYNAHAEDVEREVQLLIDRVMQYVSEGIAGAVQRRQERRK